jgi:hypothetical protein
MTISPSDIKANTNNKNSIWKKVIGVGDKPSAMVVVIDESLVKKFQIDEQYTWFEEIPTSDGILLKITQCSEPLALPKSGKEQN